MSVGDECPRSHAARIAAAGGRTASSTLSLETAVNLAAVAAGRCAYLVDRLPHVAYARSTLYGKALLPPGCVALYLWGLVFIVNVASLSRNAAALVHEVSLLGVANAPAMGSMRSGAHIGGRCSVIPAPVFVAARHGRPSLPASDAEYARWARSLAAAAQALAGIVLEPQSGGGTASVERTAPLRICPIALTGWLLEYPVVYDSHGPCTAEMPTISGSDVDRCSCCFTDSNVLDGGWSTPCIDSSVVRVEHGSGSAVSAFVSDASSRGFAALLAPLPSQSPSILGGQDIAVHALHMTAHACSCARVVPLPHAHGAHRPVTARRQAAALVTPGGRTAEGQLACHASIAFSVPVGLQSDARIALAIAAWRARHAASAVDLTSESPELEQSSCDGCLDRHASPSSWVRRMRDARLRRGATPCDTSAFTTSHCEGGVSALLLDPAVVCHDAIAL